MKEKKRGEIIFLRDTGTRRKKKGGVIRGESEAFSGV